MHLSKANLAGGFGLRAKLGVREVGSRTGKRGLHGLFEAQVKKTPHAIAVDCEGQQLSYSKLNERANQIARYLKNQGAGIESLVGVMLDRSVNMVAALLGILKAGAAFVPIDSQYPRKRIQEILKSERLLESATLIIKTYHQKVFKKIYTSKR